MAIVPTARRGEEARLLECIRAGEHVSHVETVRQARDGRLVDVAVSTSPIVDDAGRVVGASSITRDVTAQKRAEASRRRRADRRRLLWESAALLLTGDSREAMMQALFARIAPPLRLDHYAYFTTAGDAPLRLEASAGVRGPGAPGRDSIAVLRALCAVVARERQPIVSGQRRSDGGGLEAPGLEPLGSRAFAALPLVVRGRAAGVLVFGGRTREPFEPDEVDFFETICHYVTATHERLRLIERLREADRRKDEFLATLAHELRNPLAPIRNALSIIRLRPDDAGRVRQARGLMDRQLDQMVRLIDDLLDVSRITRGKLVLRRERVTLDAVVSSAVDTSQPLVDARGHRLTVSLPAEPIWLDADPVRLAQVFSNLLNNAAKYMERGGDVTLAATVVDRQVAVSVRDTGIGIPGDALGRIFDMFSQVGPTNDRTRAGLGIGLTLVKRLVDLHGGDVTVSSGGPGAGTEFVVRLPVARPDTAASRERAARPDDARVGRCRVLVADDNQDSAESMAVILRMMGHEVRTVHDGIQAVDEAGAFRPDLVLLDIGMPQVDGYEAARRIRAQPWGRAVALVALTGWGQDEDRHRAIEAGFDRHFTKPMDIEEIEKLIAGIRASRSAPEEGGTRRP